MKEQLFGANWKSTWNGILSFLSITMIFLAGYFATMVNPSAWEVKAGAIATFASQLLKVWIGFSTLDVQTKN